jgi:Zn-finger nucleic acid-binding protein
MADNKDVIKCPACGKEMKKIFIQDSGINIDICIDGCGGIYFDNRELEKCDENHEKIDEIINSIEGKTFESIDKNAVRYCPCCYEMPMTRMGAADGEIEIDVCNNCGGKFLDHGELLKIRESQGKNNNSIDKALESIYDLNDSKIKANKRRDFFIDIVHKYI